MDLSHIRLVEIELFSFCNRTCDWCPNKDIDRKSFCSELPSSTYIRILEELKEEGFKGVLTFSRYNEPLSMYNLLKERLLEARRILPHVKLVTNTNGDYVSKEVLDGLEIDELSIMDYDCKGMMKCKEHLNESGCTMTDEDYPFIYAKKDDMDIIYYVDWPKHHINTYRGGNLNNAINMKKELRTESCYEPTYFIGIDYNGSVTPCCEIRSDSKSQKEYILGNVNKESLKEVYFNEKGRLFRQNTMYKNFSTPCMYCSKKPGRYTRNKPGMRYRGRSG